MTFRIRQLRLERKISQMQLASAINSSQASVTDWELGKKETRPEMLIAIADFFDVSLDYLCGRSDVPYVVRSYTTRNGEVICFTTETPSDQTIEGRTAETVSFSVPEEDLVQVRGKELERLVASLVDKALKDRQSAGR